MSDGEDGWSTEQIAEFQRRWDKVMASPQTARWQARQLRRALPAGTRVRLAITWPRDRLAAWLCGHGLWRVAWILWHPGRGKR